MRRILVFLPLAWLIAACGAANPKSQDNLKEAVLLFNEGVRWGRLQDVMPRVAPDHLDHFIEMHKAFGKTIKISDYEIINTTADFPKKTADVTVQIRWYRITEMEEFTTVLTQRWEETGAEWLMTAESFVSGEPF